MKILTFTDLHESYEYAEELEKKAKNAELILCAGDMTVFGDNMAQAFKFLDSFGKPVLLLHGNHESEHQLKGFCNKSKHVIFLHKTFYETENLVVLGYGGGGFSQEERDFKGVEDLFGGLIRRKKRSILMTHGPPFGTKLDNLGRGNHVGCKTYRKFIEKYQPSVAISGHIHETFHKVDKIGKTILVNPGPRGSMITL